MMSSGGGRASADPGRVGPGCGSQAPFFPSGFPLVLFQCPERDNQEREVVAAATHSEPLK
jgi:hypothetical protein